MKILKKILLVVVVLIVIVLITALFVKKDFIAESEIVINKPQQEVFAYVKQVKNQEHYNKWTLTDPNVKLDYRGTDGTVGFVSTWEGNSKVGKGEQEIKKITESERIDLELRFIKPMASTSPAYMTTERIAENQTRVKWGMSGKMVYPINFIRVFMNIEKMLGNDLHESLTSLKNILEKQ